jgi:hypothetical protein
LLGFPKAARKASTVAWIDAVLAFPPTEKVLKAKTLPGTTKLASTEERKTTALINRVSYIYSKS